MRVVIVTESFPPDVNGVAHCALQTVRHLVDRGHAPLVVAPAVPKSTAHPVPPGPGGASDAGGGDPAEVPCPVVRVPSLPLPGYPQVRVALPSRRVAVALAEHRADVVHLASPFVLGVRGMAAAARLGIPAVAVYQTDLAGYARTYMGAGEAAAWRRIRSVHAAADRTLAPSRPALSDLEAHGVPRVSLWPRGVDTARFGPERRDESLRRELAPDGELIVGYVGRLAPEKHVELLAEACGLPGVRVVVVGDGPSRAHLAETLPGAVFLGRRTGPELARIFASFDVFAHTGPFETFCQTVQEAMASGLPVVAPAAGGGDDGEAFADAVELLLERPERQRREAARAWAECFGWGTAVEAFLAAHDATVRPVRTGRSTAGARGLPKGVG
ncbi:glycosyltransferase family 1 protein [Streptomyces sp. V3I7]|uniref:glycosyltransferase family 4 protein n=1 Tax=Streptomyces sp. V3I7 TaxID=3042278 RepID=UPI002789D440|nr:glycosyltransferase family 1 protein [Streptomyces sp. V3I7]MDQ0989731.1 phosphatidylinositol alpha 1,6-mannosyltransferase [Streptomyces sp. V3I7]